MHAGLMRCTMEQLSSTTTAPPPAAGVVKQGRWVQSHSHDGGATSGMFVSRLIGQ